MHGCVQVCIGMCGYAQAYVRVSAGVLVCMGPRGFVQVFAGVCLCGQVCVSPGVCGCALMCSCVRGCEGIFRISSGYILYEFFCLSSLGVSPKYLCCTRQTSAYKIAAGPIFWLLKAGLFSMLC